MIKLTKSLDNLPIWVDNVQIIEVLDEGRADDRVGSIVTAFGRVISVKETPDQIMEAKRAAKGS